MAKVSVRRCDRCSAFDSAQLPVRRLFVIALRFDLCMNCAIVVLDDQLHDALRTTEVVTRLFGMPVVDPDQLEMVWDEATDAESVRAADELAAAAETAGAD